APFPVSSLFADGLVARWIGERGPTRPLLVAPDAGRRADVGGVAAACGAPALGLGKRRGPDGARSYAGPAGPPAARPAGGLGGPGWTVVPLARLLLAEGAASLTLVVTHLFPGAADLPARIGGPVRLVSTDTVPGEAARISVAPMLACWLRAVVV